MGRLVERGGNAEVHEFHGTVAGHQNVRGFQVTMQHELAVRMLNRARDVANETHAARKRSRMSGGERQQRLALHQLQHDEGLIVGDPRIKQACDVRVIEPREHGAFASEAGGELVGG